MALPSMKYLYPRFLTASDVSAVAHAIFDLPDGPKPSIQVIDDEGYDIHTDVAWKMRLRVLYLGRDLTCYLSALDLAGSPEFLQKTLVEGWRMAFWSDRKGKQVHG